MARPARAQAPGKIIVLGEHAVVYGQPAVAMPLDRGVAVRCVPDARGPAIDLPHAPGADALVAAFEHLAAALGRPAVRASIESAIPASAGLGSSAAVAVALARALSCAADRALDEAALLEHAASMERSFHGQPSGVDHTTCALGVPIRFVRGDPPVVERLAVPPAAWVVAISGPRQGTREKVMALRRAWEADRSGHERTFAAIGALADAGARALARGDAPELGRLMDENQRILRSLDLSTDAIDHLCARVKALGAHGAKLTGAGGGGAVIALHPEPERLRAQLEAEGVGAFVSRWEARP